MPGTCTAPNKLLSRLSWPRNARFKSTEVSATTITLSAVGPKQRDRQPNRTVGCRWRCCGRVIRLQKPPNPSLLVWPPDLARCPESNKAHRQAPAAVDPRETRRGLVRLGESKSWPKANTSGFGAKWKFDPVVGTLAKAWAEGAEAGGKKIKRRNESAAHF